MKKPTINKQQFIKHGWVIVNLSPASISLIKKASKLFLKRLQDKWKLPIKRLEEYHHYVLGDDLNTKIQADLSQLYHLENFGRKIIEASQDQFEALLGLDIHVQKYPYVRISRPNMPQDNIGIHRDTHYGCSPYELSVSIPFVDLPSSGSLGVVSGTHIQSEKSLPFKMAASEVVKGSQKHKLGFLYAPKVMSEQIRSAVKPIKVPLGKALVFSLSLVHGQEINRSLKTRIASDIRLVNSFAPIEWSRNVHSDYYEPLSISAVSKQAHQYLAANL